MHNKIQNTFRMKCTVPITAWYVGELSFVYQNFFRIFSQRILGAETKELKKSEKCILYNNNAEKFLKNCQKNSSINNQVTYSFFHFK